MTIALAALAAPALGASPAVAAKAKKCKPVSGSAAEVGGIHVKGLKCAAGQELALAYASGGEEAVADAGYNCTRKSVNGAFRVKCVGAGSEKGQLVRFTYRS